MSLPPLPEPTGAGNDASDATSLAGGSWLLSYKPIALPLVAYDGTLRIEPTATGARVASGDLYQRSLFFVREHSFSFPHIPILRGPSNPANGIPIHARAQYRYYLRVTQIGTVSNTEFALSFEMWKFTTGSNIWANEGISTVAMAWIAAPPGYPSPQSYAEGDLTSLGGVIVGRFKMGWVSSNYRKAVVEIDSAPGCKAPSESGSGQNWASVFDSLGWDVVVTLDETNVTSASVSDGKWTDANMHETMLAHRKAVNLDAEWHYHILSVNIILSTPRGIMYDAGATDSDNVPREGVGIANDWIVPSSPEWGSEKTKKFADSEPLFFRTAVHELGHAFGLYHDTVDNGFMNTTGVIAVNGSISNPFPTNIKWQYAPQGLRGLRHFPDPFVRPGGVSFGQESFTSPQVADVGMDLLELKVTPLELEVPLGAPVRVSLELKNTAPDVAVVPADISLRSENVRGEVKKLDGGVRTFKALIRCVDEAPEFKQLKPGETISTSLTLLRGGEGALFHSSGIFEITVTVRWPLGGGVFAMSSGSTTVFILPVQNAEHGRTAHKMLTTPDTQLVLVMGQSRKGHLKEGVDAIKEAVEDEVLGDHYASIEARRLLQLGDDERAQRALNLLNGKKRIVFSGLEKTKLDKLFGKAKQDGKLKENEAPKLGEIEKQNSHEYVKV